jgi:ketosteroid isomerase-like protein
MTATRTLDVTTLSAAIEARDAQGQLAAYAPDAELTIVDAANPPSRPRVLRGHDEIGPYLADVCARDMTHEVRTTVVTGERLAVEVACRYADGTRVLCLCVAELAGGRIARQRTVQAWDS